MNSILALIAIVILLSIFNARPKKIKLSERTYMCSVSLLPDGLYTVLFKETSHRMAVFIRSMPQGSYDEVYYIHHTELPREKNNEDFKESFLVEKGKVIA
jgi:hypothetical protein